MEYFKKVSAKASAILKGAKQYAENLAEHVARASKRAVVAFAAGVVVVAAPLASPQDAYADTPAQGVRLQVPPKLKAALAKTQKQANLETRGVATGWAAVLQSWKAVVDAPTEHEYVRALPGVLDALEAQHEALGRFERATLSLRQRYMDILTSSGVEMTPPRPALKVVAPDLAGFAETLVGSMTEGQRKLVAQRGALEKLTAKFESITRSMASASAAGTAGDYVEAIRLIDESLINLSSHKAALAAQSGAVLARIEMGADQRNGMNSLTVEDAIEAGERAEKGLLRFMDGGAVDADDAAMPSANPFDSAR